MFTPDHVKQQLDALRQEIRQQLESIVNINSNSAHIDGLNRTARAIQAAAAEHDIAFSLVPVAGTTAGPFQLFHDGAGDASGGFYGIIGHFDTVHLPESAFSHCFTQGDRLYGPGVFDMKAGVIASLYAVIIAGRLMERPLPVKIIYNCDEEIGSPDSRLLIQQHLKGAGGAFVFEPGRGTHRGLVTARKGILMGEMTTSGIPAHAGEDPEAGADAIVEAARKIDALHGLSDPASGTVVTVGRISGGNAANQIPDNCHCTLDVRVDSEAAEKAIRERIDRIMRTTGIPGTRTHYALRLARPPFEEAPASRELFQAYAEAAEAFGFPVERFQSGAGSDGNFTAAAGIPTLDGLGPCGGGAHSNEEYILLESLYESICTFALFFANRLKKGALV